MNKVLVIGDSCEDRFTYGISHRLCPDIPAPVFIPKKDVVNSGMAGNVYENLRGFGLKCDLITNTEKVIKQRFIDEKTNHTFLRVDTNDKVQRVTFDPLQIKSQDYKAIVIADYGKGFLHEVDISLLCNVNDNVFLDTKKVLGDWAKEAKFIKINHTEYARSKKANAINDELDSKIIRTAGPEGCFYDGRQYEVVKVEVKDVSGAGDSFMAGLAVEYLSTNNIIDSISFAHKCATTGAQKRGVSVVH